MDNVDCNTSTKQLEAKYLLTECELVFILNISYQMLMEKEE